MLGQIKSYYENYDEEGRLFRDKAHLPEYLTTIRYFDRLFAPGSRILDACAGTGRYFFFDIRSGFNVMLKWLAILFFSLLLTGCLYITLDKHLGQKAKG